MMSVPAPCFITRNCSICMHDQLSFPLVQRWCTTNELCTDVSRGSHDMLLLFVRVINTFLYVLEKNGLIFGSKTAGFMSTINKMGFLISLHDTRGYYLHVRLTDFLSARVTNDFLLLHNRTKSRAGKCDSRKTLQEDMGMFSTFIYFPSLPTIHFYEHPKLTKKVWSLLIIFSISQSTDSGPQGEARWSKSERLRLPEKSIYTQKIQKNGGLWFLSVGSWLIHHPAPCLHDRTKEKVAAGVCGASLFIKVNAGRTVVVDTVCLSEVYKNGFWHHMSVKCL